jgi:hypothetical protein
MRGIVGSVILAQCLLSCGADEEFTFVGRVVDPSGNPHSGVDVTVVLRVFTDPDPSACVWSKRECATTDAEGVFSASIRGDHFQYAYVTAWKDGFAVTSAQIHGLKGDLVLEDGNDMGTSCVPGAGDTVDCDGNIEPYDPSGCRTTPANLPLLSMLSLFLFTHRWRRSPRCRQSPHA